MSLAEQVPTGRRAGAVAELGLGLAAVGRPAYINRGRDVDLPGDRSPAALEARAHDLLDAAVALGVRYVDAARSYGLAEQFLSTWLREAGAPPPFVASKWGYRYVADWRADAREHEVKEHSQAMFDRQWAESAALLGPWLRLYQVHSLTTDSPLWEDTGLLRRLAEVRAGGTELGFSTSGPAQGETVRRATELLVDGLPLFSSVQTTWNLLEPSAGEALAEASGAGLRVVVKEALANGRLLEAPSSAAGPAAAAAREHGVGLDAIALGAAMAQPWCDVVLSGAVTVGQLESNAAARRVAAHLPLDELLAPQPPQAYWAERSRLAWS